MSRHKYSFAERIRLSAMWVALRLWLGWLWLRDPLTYRAMKAWFNA